MPQLNTAQTVIAKGQKVRVFVNDYDITMLEINHGTRPQYISLNKAGAILDTRDFPSLLEPTVFKGRNLFNVLKQDGKTFRVGANKIQAVLENAGEIEGYLAEQRENEAAEQGNA